MGQEGRLPLQSNEMRRVLESGAAWAVGEGFGRTADLDHIEGRGCLPGASADAVSDRAKARGADQLGTLGSGNHFLEVQVVDQVLDAAVAARFGLGRVGQVAVFIHTGSRGLGHQVCEDYLRVAEDGLRHYGFALPDRQLACMPFGSPEAKRYLAAMAAAANFAFANRQLITHWVREALARVLKRSPEDLGLGIVYDVAHNIAKVEEYLVDGKRESLCVHRKGATRAFPAGDPSLPADYQDVGQPVLIPGDMGRYSFVAVGTEQAMRESFGSVCHGAGRVQSRTAARRSLKGVDMVDQLGAKGIVVRAHSRGGLVEEASEAYKDVAEVVHVVAGAGLARPVIRLRPLAVIKG
jgi:tRNA-splicing ligase RtcB